MLLLFIIKVQFLVLTMPLIKVCTLNNCMIRPICPTCSARPVAVNRYVNEQVYYRKQCDPCLRIGKKLKPLPPAWAKAGYKKKDKCDVCGFKAKTARQMFVFHIDGNLKNTNWANLKTLCANCQIELVNRVSWKQAPIVPDF